MNLPELSAAELAEISRNIIRRLTPLPRPITPAAVWLDSERAILCSVDCKVIHSGPVCPKCGSTEGLPIARLVGRERVAA